MQAPRAQIQTGSLASSDVASGSIQLAAELVLPGISMRFARDEEIFAEEDNAEFAYKVMSGAVRDVRILRDGRRQIGAFHLPGEVFGLECGGRHAYTAEAVTDSEIALVRRSVLERAAESEAAAARALWAQTARDLQQLQVHMLHLGRTTAAERVRLFLLGMAERGGSSRAVDLPMYRCDIADYLGLTIETVSRTLTQLVREGAISMPNSRHIVLGDSLALAET